MQYSKTLTPMPLEDRLLNTRVYTKDGEGMAAEGMAPTQPRVKASARRRLGGRPRRSLGVQSPGKSCDYTSTGNILTGF